MLVLTRRAGQAIRIGNGIEIQVVRVEGDRVVLGIVAPRDVAIVRSELIAEVGAEVGQAAAGRSQVLGLLRPRR
jgi:carbon storage regulator